MEDGRKLHRHMTKTVLQVWLRAISFILYEAPQALFWAYGDVNKLWLIKSW